MLPHDKKLLSQVPDDKGLKDDDPTAETLDQWGTDFREEFDKK